MNQQLREKLIWGWLRLVLGVGQMSLAVATLISFVNSGASKLTMAFLLITTVLLATSRLLYHGKKNPHG